MVWGQRAGEGGRRWVQGESEKAVKSPHPPWWGRRGLGKGQLPSPRLLQSPLEASGSRLEGRVCRDESPLHEAVTLISRDPPTTLSDKVSETLHLPQDIRKQSRTRLSSMASFLHFKHHIKCQK